MCSLGALQAVVLCARSGVQDPNSRVAIPGKAFQSWGADCRLKSECGVGPSKGMSH